MTITLDETHDPSAASWVSSANQSGTDFPIHNLPYGIFRRRGNSDDPPRIGVAIGDYALDLAGCIEAGLFNGLAPELLQACASASLNQLMSLGRPYWTALRRNLHSLLRAHESTVANDANATEKHLLPIAELELLIPAQVGDYTDFCTSIYHATNVGRMFRPDNPLMPNYKYMPIGYHGRASSIIVSGSQVRRPVGQTKPNSSELVLFGPTRQLDYEMEVGFFIGPGNDLGAPVTLDHAEDHIFGFCIVNDWSARDIQAWEYQPLGPFLAKSFATTISPWVVTLDALAPYRVPAFRRLEGDPGLLPYLLSTADRERGGIGIIVEVFLSSQKMREHKSEPIRLSRGNMGDLYWTAAQMLTHHTSNGCNLRPGDLLATGTISGNSENSQGCLLEITQRGAKPFNLPTGESRQFLEDGDEIIMRAGCEIKGGVRIGFGPCSGVVEASK